MSDGYSGWVAGSATARCMKRRNSVGVSVTEASCASLGLKANAATGTTLAAPLAGSAWYCASVARCSAVRNALACAVMFWPVEEYLSARRAQNVTG